MPLVFGRSILGFAVADTGVTWTDPDLNNASYDSVSLNIATEEPIPTGLTFSTDGTNAYIAGPNNDTVYQYSLSTAWDLSTASYASKTLSVSGQAALSGAIQFKDDGTSLYVLDRNLDDVFQYDLTTAWDVSTASYASKSMDATSEDTAPRGMYFKTDGTKVYIAGDTNNSIYQYALSTAWDISTGSFETGKSFSVGTQTTVPCGVYFSPNGDKMWVSSTADGDIYQYSLSTAWDVSTASYDSVSFDASTQVTTGLHDLYFKSDGSKMYLISNSTDAIFQYSTVAPAWTTPDIANASYDSVSLSVISQESLGHDIFFKPDGTKLYLVGTSGDDVNEYSLSTAWDLSTASYAQNFSVQTEETAPCGIFFKTDGTKMYITGTSGDDVNEYNLSTAWDISSASYSQNFSISTQIDNSRAIFFKSDGTKMFIADQTGQDINEYSLSTAWDVSTASFTQLFSTASQSTSPQAVYFSPDGTEMFVGDAASDIYKYSLSTGWDLSTASYDSITFDASSQTIVLLGLSFKSDGSKMYTFDNNTDAVYQYST